MTQQTAIIFFSCINGKYLLIIAVWGDNLFLMDAQKAMTGFFDAGAGNAVLCIHQYHFFAPESSLSSMPRSRY